MSFTLEAGETLGLVGPSGAGKSTVVSLALRFFDPQQGRILLGGQDLKDMPLEYLRRHVAVVGQDTYLFHGTVAENLRFAKPDATQEELEEAARIANAHDFIQALPNGYHTVVGERAVRLSGGQRQRIAIARALLKDAPILILDEALSSVDTQNEAAIQKASGQSHGGQDDADHCPSSFERDWGEPYPSAGRGAGGGVGEPPGTGCGRGCLHSVDGQPADDARRPRRAHGSRACRGDKRAGALLIMVLTGMLLTGLLADNTGTTSKPTSIRHEHALRPVGGGHAES